LRAWSKFLERKGVLSKQDVRGHHCITPAHPRAEQANPPLEAILETYVMTEVEEKIIQVILDANGLTARQAVGELLARRTAP
jgi:hypothetical protein